MTNVCRSEVNIKLCLPSLSCPVDAKLLVEWIDSFVNPDSVLLWILHFHYMPLELRFLAVWVYVWFSVDCGKVNVVLFVVKLKCRRLLYLIMCIFVDVHVVSCLCGRNMNKNAQCFSGINSNIYYGNLKAILKLPC